jgi:hypothetical protein
MVWMVWEQVDMIASQFLVSISTFPEKKARQKVKLLQLKNRSVCMDCKWFGFAQRMGTTT